jgi:thioredoxin 1
MITANIVEAHRSNYAAHVREQRGIALAEFWAHWSPESRQLAPTLTAVAAERPHVRIATVDVDDNPGLCADCSIQEVPTLIVYRDGRETSRLVGLVTKDGILAALDNAANHGTFR